MRWRTRSSRVRRAKGETTLFGLLLAGSSGSGAEPRRWWSSFSKGGRNWCKVNEKEREGGADWERSWGKEREKKKKKKRERKEIKLSGLFGFSKLNLYFFGVSDFNFVLRNFGRVFYF